MNYFQLKKLVVEQCYLASTVVWAGMIFSYSNESHKEPCTRVDRIKIKDGSVVDHIRIHFSSPSS